ncbi:MAG: hypothetical protein AAFX78_02020 [Cyanobacteria bacterium J06638_20]
MAQNQIYTGMGNFSLVVAGTPKRLLNVEPMEFELAGDAESVSSTKWVDGVLQNAGTGRSSETWSLTLGVEAINWTVWQLTLGEFAETTANYLFPKMKYDTIPEAPHEITDADIGANADVLAVFVEDGRTLTKVAAVGDVDATGEFAVTTGAGSKLTFDASDEGKLVGYRVLKTLPTIETIGVEENFTSIGNLEFNGVGYGDTENVHVKIPQMAAAGLPSVSFSEVTKFDLEYTISVAAGQRRPFTLGKIPKNS